MKYSFVVLLFCLLSQSSSAQTKSQTVTFANFKAIISNFKSENYTYQRYPQENQEIPAKFDTIFLGENPCEDNGWYIDGQQLKITSKGKADVFEVAYAFEIDTKQTFDDRNGAAPAEGWDAWYSKSKNWKYRSTFQKCKSTSAKTFRLPSRGSSILSHFSKDIKRLHNLRDTSISIPREVGSTEVDYVRKGALFYNEVNYLYLRIQRFTQGKLKETKYLLVGLSEGCD